MASISKAMVAVYHRQQRTVNVKTHKIGIPFPAASGSSAPGQPKGFRLKAFRRPSRRRHDGQAPGRYETVRD